MQYDTCQKLLQRRTAVSTSMRGYGAILFPLFIGGGGACADRMFLSRILFAEKGFAPVPFTQFS